MTTSTDLQSDFEYELKRKLSEKARNPILEMKTLINCFKYYDTNNEGQIDKSIWVKGILRTGVTNFSDDDLDKLFNSYVQSYSGKIDYKDFCNYIYGRERIDPLSKSLKNTNLNENILIGSPNMNNNVSKKYQKIDLNQYNKNYNYKQNRGYGNINNFNNINIYGNNNDKSNGKVIQQNDEFEILINKIKELIHIDNGVVFYSFLKYLKTNEEPISHKISIEDLSVAIQELHLNISYDEMHEFFNNLDVEKTGRIPTNDVINIIKGTLNDKRKSYINSIFSKIDTDKEGKIKANDFKILFNARNHPDVLEGKKTEQEIYNQFCYTIDVYIRVNNILDNSLNNDQFIDYYSGISPSIKTDDDFKNILGKVWNIEKPKNRINKYSILNDNNDNAFEDDNLGINSIFLGISKTQRPKYDYNYDYLEEFSKSSPNLLDNKKNKSRYGNSNNNSANTNTNTNTDKNSNEAYNGQILNYSYKKNNQTKRNNSRNTALSSIGEKIINDYGNINANINQTISYSKNLPIKNINSVQKSPEKYFNYESRKTPIYKGKKIFKTQRYNPITDEYIQENINENNMTESTNVLVVQNNIQTPNNNLYTRNNYSQSNSQNNYIKEEIGSLPENKENNISNKNEGAIHKESENQNQKYNLKENSSLVKFRNILKSQGTKSIFRFQRMLSIYDRKHSGLIAFDNFYNIFKTYYSNIPLEDIKSIFSLFDTTSPKDNTEIKIISIFQIKYDELLKSIIGNMPLNRQIIVKKVFDSFEKGSDGKIMTNDIKTKFNYSRHPDVLSGKNSAIEIYNDFLDFIETFREYNDNLKGSYSFGMSYDEFADFYSEISMYVEDEDNFEKLLTNCWNLEDENTNANNNNNITNSYQRSNQYNNQNIRMKAGSQIINNNIF